jgi:hypothetical protein
MSDATTDTSAAPWRLVLADGTVRCANVVNGTRVVLEGAGETFVSWDAGDPEAVERYLLATAVRLGWRVREVVPPGERTRAEVARAVERAEKAEAILAGSTALPTASEITAVADAGGWWFVALRGRCGVHNAEGVSSHVRGAAMGWWAPDEARWWPCIGGVIVARPGAAPAALEAL